MRWLPYELRLRLSNWCYKRHRKSRHAWTWYILSLKLRLHFRPYLP